MSRSTRPDAKRDIIFEIFIKLIQLYELADRMVSIEGSQTNLKCLLVCSRLVTSWFETNFSKLPQLHIDNNFEPYFISNNMSQYDVNINMSGFLISDIQKANYEYHVEMKKSCQEQKAFRESFLKSQTDFDIDIEEHEGEDEMKLLSIEDAVLIIQKLERKYQAISRRNYVRFVRERAAELHGQQAEIDATQAAIRIQARTRGYFARKMVREMRSKELDVLGMTPASIIRKKLEEREAQRTVVMEKIQQVDNYPTELETVIESLRNTFFLSKEVIEPVKMPKINRDKTDGVFLDACFRGIVAPIAVTSIEEMISQKEVVQLDGKVFNFDVGSFLALTLCIPLALNTWTKKQTKCRWMLITGGQGSGKTSWVKGIAKACYVTHVHISKNVVTMGKRRIYTVIKKLAKQERRLLISIDKIDIMKKDQKAKGYNHRQLLLRNFLTDISATSATVIGMTKVEELDSPILDLFPLRVHLSNPTHSTRYDLAVDCLSRNLEQDRLPKMPGRLYDIEKQTNEFNYGKTVKFVTNRWSATNNRTNLSNST